MNESRDVDSANNPNNSNGPGNSNGPDRPNDPDNPNNAPDWFRDPERYKVWFRNPFVITGLSGLVTVTVLAFALRRIPDPPTVQRWLPEYTLFDQNGEPFGTEQLEGKVYVINTFFTRCPTICPRLMDAMTSLLAKYEAEEERRQAGCNGGLEEGERFDVHLVSISVDPLFDRPDILMAYAEERGLDTSRWTLLTGDEDSIRALLLDGFAVDMGEAEEIEPNLIDISHSAKLIMVDWEGGVRGWYSYDEMGIDEVFNRSLHVLDSRE